MVCISIDVDVGDGVELIVQVDTSDDTAIGMPLTLSHMVACSR